MATVTGNVKAKSANKFGFGIMVNDKWYNSKYEIKAEKGDEVEFDDGGKNYIKDLKVQGKAAGNASALPRSSGSGYSRGVFPIPANDGQRSIIRQNSVTNAVNLYGHLLANSGGTHKIGDDPVSDVLIGDDPVSDVLIGDDPVSDVLLMAREFEKYSAGDLDAEIAESINEQFEVK